MTTELQSIGWRLFRLKFGCDPAVGGRVHWYMSRSQNLEGVIVKITKFRLLKVRVAGEPKDRTAWASHVIHYSQPGEVSDDD